LGLPSKYQPVHLPTLQAEAATVAAALAEQLGRPVRVKTVVDDSLVPAGDPTDEDSREDPGDLAASGPVGPGGIDSPVGLVIETFGATVESETVRE
jgi:hypothetical protein